MTWRSGERGRGGRGGVTAASGADHLASPACDVREGKSAAAAPIAIMASSPEDAWVATGVKKG